MNPEQMPPEAYRGLGNTQSNRPDVEDNPKSLRSLSRDMKEKDSEEEDLEEEDTEIIPRKKFTASIGLTDGGTRNLDGKEQKNIEQALHEIKQVSADEEFEQLQAATREQVEAEVHEQNIHTKTAIAQIELVEAERVLNDYLQNEAYPEQGVLRTLEHDVRLLEVTLEEMGKVRRKIIGDKIKEFRKRAELVDITQLKAELVKENETLQQDTLQAEEKYDSEKAAMQNNISELEQTISTIQEKIGEMKNPNQGEAIKELQNQIKKAKTEIQIITTDIEEETGFSLDTLAELDSCLLKQQILEAKIFELGNLERNKKVA